MKKITFFFKEFHDLILFIVFYFLFILPNLGSTFIQTNAPDWIKRSVRFYIALFRGDFVATYQKYHPGVTLMWLVGFAARTFDKFQDIFYGKRLDLFNFHVFTKFNFWAKLNIALVYLFILILIYLVLRRCFGRIFAFFVIFFMGSEPFVGALVRMIVPDALLTVFMLASLVFLFRDTLKKEDTPQNEEYPQKQECPFLILSGVFLGLALLTKVTAIILFPVIFVYLFLFNRKCSLRNFFMVSAFCALTFIILFPAMWVNPVNTIKNILFDGLIDTPLRDYASPIISKDLSRNPFIERFLSYPLVFIFRTTPVLLLSFLWGVILFISQLPSFFKKRSSSSLERFVFLIFLFGIFYYLPISFAAKKIYKYVLPFFFVGAVFGAYGIINVAKRLKEKAKIIFLLGVSFLQMSFPLSLVPNYLLFFNPLLGGIKQAPLFVDMKLGATGYKEVADYLNKKNLTADTEVAAYPPRSLGPFVNVRVSDIRNPGKKDYILIPLYAYNEYEYLLTPCYILEYTVRYKGLDYLFLYRNICK